MIRKDLRKIRWKMFPVSFWPWPRGRFRPAEAFCGQSDEIGCRDQSQQVILFVQYKQPMHALINHRLGDRCDRRFWANEENVACHELVDVDFDKFLHGVGRQARVFPALCHLVEIAGYIAIGLGDKLRVVLFILENVARRDDSNTVLSLVEDRQPSDMILEHQLHRRL